MRKITVRVCVIAAMLVVAGGAAWAMDCFIANRSAQGNTSAAAHSPAWTFESIEEFAHGDEFPPGFDPDCFLEHWRAGGGPAGFTVRSNKVIGEDSSNPNLANRKGLDHIDESFEALIGASLAACHL